MLRTITTLIVLASCTCCSAQELTRITTHNSDGSIVLSSDATEYFLEFGKHSYAPDSYLGPDGEDLSAQIDAENTIPIALFQGLTARKVVFPDTLSGQSLSVTKAEHRDAFWDQIITVNPKSVSAVTRYEIVETGDTGSALPPPVRDLQLTAEQIQAQRDSLTDPHIPNAVDHEISWADLESVAFPLDFQKVLIASANDPSPGFVFQNGQWLTTWLSRDLPKWTKEDHWFAPALLIGHRLVRPAPLSAKTGFVTTDSGTTLPMWTLTWRYQETIVHQSIFSHPAATGKPHVYVRFQLENATSETRLALGVGRRPNVHYWDNREHERTPIPFFTLRPDYHKNNKQLIDQWDNLLLESSRHFDLEAIGPFEMLLIFSTNDQGSIYLRTPQSEAPPPDVPFNKDDFRDAKQNFESFWTEHLQEGAQATLPDVEWMRRIDIWQSQIAAITRVHYQGQERLSYGAYFYQAYFGPEEGWPIVALAQWDRSDESQRQAEIMLSPENRSKDNVHHQARNGVFAWYAAEVARLTNDRDWLASVAPALIENADWTINARKLTQESDPPITRGLLPPHIYGGDIRDTATSLYASAVCWKGLSETAEVFRSLGPESLAEHADRYQFEADDLHARLREVINQVVDRDTEPPFLPLALALPSLDGKHEGPYDQLTHSRLGNYWNLFAPSVLELGLVTDPDTHAPNSWLLGYMQEHGGLWASLPRFHNGLDAAYSIGVINELINRSASDVRYRNQALAALQSFFLHAVSRNGYTIPEVAGLFPYRLDTVAYEQLVRESPWNFGMYSPERYLDGHISFTEPLGAAAGEALWMIRNALILETRNDRGQPDGRLYLLSTVPADWFAEGKEIKLDNFPTYYGTINLHTRSHIDSTGEIELNYHFTPNETRELKTIIVRLAPPGASPRDIHIEPKRKGNVHVKF